MAVIKRQAEEGSQEKVLDPFGHEPREMVSVDASEHIVLKYGLKFDKELEQVVPYVTGEEDTFKSIQSFKDQCGLIAAKAAIMRGLVDPSAYADDGKHSGDVSMLADNINDAYEQAQIAGAKNSAAMRELNLSDINTDDLADKVAAALAAKFAKPEEGKEE